MIHKVLLVASLAATVAVAGTTVDLQVRARLRTYELARAREAIVESEEALDVVRLRVLARFTPERLARAAAELRERRRQGGAAEPQAGVEETTARL
ncbi:MAG: hypothetical protein JNL90_09130 [Planctomycetes bacterium]|nr:hypothetical protein [Planctomycetota bacterium]